MPSKAPAYIAIKLGILQQIALPGSLAVKVLVPVEQPSKVVSANYQAVITVVSANLTERSYVRFSRKKLMKIKTFYMMHKICTCVQMSRMEFR